MWAGEPGASEAAASEPDRISRGLEPVLDPRTIRMIKGTTQTRDRRRRQSAHSIFYRPSPLPSERPLPTDGRMNEVTNCAFPIASSGETRDGTHSRHQYRRFALSSFLSLQG
ncbi:hypothetical protein ISCGN_014016 [Ixodes scapularis]